MQDIHEQIDIYNSKYKILGIEPYIKLKIEHLVEELCKLGMTEDSSIITVVGSETYGMLIEKKTKYFTESYECLRDMLLKEIGFNTT